MESDGVQASGSTPTFSTQKCPEKATAPFSEGLRQGGGVLGAKSRLAWRSWAVRHAVPAGPAGTARPTPPCLRYNAPDRR